MRRKYQIFTLHIVLIIFLCAFSSKTELDAAKQAYIFGDYATAYQKWLGQAENGVPEAQFNLGYLFENGQGVPLDLFSAAKWYELAARQNYPAANQMLKHVRLKIKTSIRENLGKWLPKAEAGDPVSQRALSEVLAAGQIVAKNNIEALKWLLLSLENTKNNTVRRRMLRFESNLRQRMTTLEIEEAMSRITSWKSLRIK
ncbi:MAG: sel1 repeat family protein [Sneathiella sp.]|nr:sel1 repeat family protein [Sneathiella sp.]